MARFRGALEEARGELVEVGVVGGVAAAQDQERVVAALGGFRRERFSNCADLQETPKS